jgi:hypothetical protein
VTKLRAPLSIEQALQRIAGQLTGGVDEMARVAQRQPGTIRNWMDPDRAEQVSLDASIELDLAFQAEGGKGAPLFEAYAFRLQLAEASRFGNRHRLLDHAHGVVKEGGEAFAAIIAAARPGATAADLDTAYRETAEAFEQLRDILPLLSGQMAQPP